jgi:hypothetical protein
VGEIIDEKLLQRIQMNYTGKFEPLAPAPGVSTTPPSFQQTELGVDAGSHTSTPVGVLKQVGAGFIGWVFYSNGAFLVVFIGLIINLSTNLTWMGLIVLGFVFLTTLWQIMWLALQKRFWVFAGAGLAMAVNYSMWLYKLGYMMHGRGWPGGDFFFAVLPFPIGYLLFMC